MSRIAASRGVTLVELLLAIVIFAIAGVGLLSSYHWALQLMEVGQQSSVATNDLKDIMERIKATPFTRLNTDFPHGVANGPAGQFTYTNVVGGAYTLPGEQITVTHSPNTAADPRELIVQLTWTSAGRTYQRSVRTLRTSRAS